MNAKQRRLRYIDYLGHMLDAVTLAQSYVEGLSKDDFLRDRKTQQAVILNIVVIGEAATQLVDEHPTFAAQHPEVPWQKMRGMRNRMAHGYFDINLEVAWETVQHALPELECKILNVQRVIE